MPISIYFSGLTSISSVHVIVAKDKIPKKIRSIYAMPISHFIQKWKKNVAMVWKGLWFHSMIQVRFMGFPGSCLGVPVFLGGGGPGGSLGVSHFIQKWKKNVATVWNGR